VGDPVISVLLLPTAVITAITSRRRPRSGSAPKCGVARYLWDLGGDE
jgi:hypothetical protein